LYSANTGAVARSSSARAASMTRLYSACATDFLLSVGIILLSPAKAVKIDHTFTNLVRKFVANGSTRLILPYCATGF
jgi:hypothetical protein